MKVSQHEDRITEVSQVQLYYFQERITEINRVSLLENRKHVFDRMQTFFLKMGRPYDYLTDGPIPFDLSDGDSLVIDHVVERDENSIA